MVRNTVPPVKRLAMHIYVGLFSEAAQLFVRGSGAANQYYRKISNKHGKGKALSILAHKLGRAVYFMLKNRQGFDLNKFLAA